MALALRLVRNEIIIIIIIISNINKNVTVIISH